MKFFDFILSFAALISFLVASYLFATDEGISKSANNPNKDSVNLKKSGESSSKDIQNPISAQLKWKYIVIHHSSTNSGNAKIFDRYHREEMKIPDGLAYHFVIGNGNKSGNGEVEISSRWHKQIPGPHCFDSSMNEQSIGICLVGDFEKGKPSLAQTKALEELLRKLMKEYQIPPERIIGHQEVDKGKTDCPGKNFPMADLRLRLK